MNEDELIRRLQSALVVFVHPRRVLTNGGWYKDAEISRKHYDLCKELLHEVGEYYRG